MDSVCFACVLHIVYRLVPDYRFVHFVVSVCVFSRAQVKVALFAPILMKFFRHFLCYGCCSFSSNATAPTSEQFEFADFNYARILFWDSASFAQSTRNLLRTEVMQITLLTRKPTKRMENSGTASIKKKKQTQ